MVPSSKPFAPIATLLAIVFGLLAAPSGAAAAEGPTFALKPATPTSSGYFVLKGKPGATVSGKVRVLNVGASPGTTGLYAVDATTGQTSGAVYRSRDQSKREVGRWTAIGTGSLSLAAGQSRVVSFRVRIPAGAAPGQYLGGIVAQRATGSAAAESPGGKSSFKVRVQELNVVAVLVNVPGPRHPQMSLTGIKGGSQPGHQSVLLGIGNTGNVLVKGRGSLKIVTSAGKPVERASFAVDTFVPHTHIGFPVYIRRKALPPGHYRGTVAIVYDGDKLTRTFPFTITAGQTAQVFGSPAAATASVGSSSSDTTLVYALIALSVLSLATAFYFWRGRRHN